jgi:hypothetical protein
MTTLSLKNTLSEESVFLESTLDCKWNHGMFILEGLLEQD